MFLNLYISVICICFGFRTSNFEFCDIRNTLYASRFTKLPSTSVENPLQINLFMQNKPNFRKSQMNVSIFSQMDYENLSDWTIGQSKPNSNPNKPNCRKGKIDAKCVFTKDFRKKYKCSVRINKPNPRKTQNERKRFFTKGL